MDFKSYNAEALPISLDHELDKILKALNLDQNKNCEALSFKENIPFPNEIEAGLYRPPLFSINDLVDTYPVDKIKCLQIWGFLSTPEGIERFTSIEQLVLSTFIYSYSQIKKAVDKEKLFFTIDLLWYPKLTQLIVERLDNVLNIEKSNITHIKFIRNHVVKKFLITKFPDTLEYLEVAGFTKLKDFSVFEKVKNLKKLVFRACNNLMDFSAIEMVKNLEELVIIQYNKIDISNLKSKSIKSLKIERQGKKAIASIHFIKNLPNLEKIWIDCNIEDKDLTPLIEHPNLKEIIGLHNHKYNYTLSEVLKMRANSFVKEKPKMDNLSIFKQIDSNKLQEHFDTWLEVHNESVMFDLNFESDKIASSILDKAKELVKNIEVQDKKNLEFINYNFNAEKKGIVREYLTFHLEELEEELGNISAEDLLNRLKLNRVGFYPDSKGVFAVFDYSFDRDISDELIVVRTDENGKLISIDTES